MREFATRPDHVLMLVGSTINQRRRSGIHRVTIEAARSLPSHVKLDLVRWDEVEGGLRLLDSVELDSIFGSGDWPPGMIVQQYARRVGRPFGELLRAPKGMWLLYPEVAWHAEHGPEVLARVISQCREWDLRIAAIFYDLIPIENPTYADAAARHEAYIVELLRCDLICAISKDSALRLSEFWRGRKVSQWPPIVPIMLPDGGFTPSRRGSVRQTSFREGRPFLAVVGTVEPRKRQVQLLRGIQRAREHSKAVRQFNVVVIGSLHPAVAHAFNELIARHDWIKYQDYLSEAELAEALSRAEFTAFASEDEGYGLPISESLAMGTPCLCANFGAMAEIAQGGGCLTVDVRDEQALQSAITSLCEDAALLPRLRAEIAMRSFKTWSDYSELVLDAMSITEAPHPVVSVQVETFLANDTFDLQTLDRLSRADVVSFPDSAARAQFISAASKLKIAHLLPARMPIGDPALDYRALEAARSSRRQVAMVERAFAEGRASISAANPTRRIFLRVLISTFKRCDFVVANVNWILKAVFDPVWADVDLVVVDGNSEDGTLEALRSIEDSRLRVVASPTNVGMLAGLREAGRVCGAEYLWVIGDDDFLRPAQFRSVLEKLRKSAGLPLGFTNFSVYHRASLNPTDSPAGLISESRPVADHVASSGVVKVREAAEQTDNLFTAIYAIIWRADIFSAAYDHAFDGTAFANMVEAIPCADLILSRYADCDALWHASPAIAGNAHNSWSRHRPRWHGVIMPLAFAQAREAGVDPARLQSWADIHKELLREAIDIARLEKVAVNLSPDDLELAQMFFRSADINELLA